MWTALAQNSKFKNSKISKKIAILAKVKTKKFKKEKKK